MALDTLPMDLHRQKHPIHVLYALVNLGCFIRYRAKSSGNLAQQCSHLSLLVTSCDSTRHLSHSGPQISQIPINSLWLMFRTNSEPIRPVTEVRVVFGSSAVPGKTWITCGRDRSYGPFLVQRHVPFLKDCESLHSD